MNVLENGSKFLWGIKQNQSPECSKSLLLYLGYSSKYPREINLGVTKLEQI